jgi:putative acetyltransferase
MEISLVYGFAESDRVAVADLLRAYEVGIGVSLGFQDFAGEVAELPGAYAPPRGQMILARAAGQGLVGCVALRAVAGAPQLCELKRLYVRQAARGSGLGRRLTLAALDEARRLGYSRIRLDTMTGMTEAQTLYRALGFRQVGTTTGEPALLLFERGLD